MIHCTKHWVMSQDRNAISQAGFYHTQNVEVTSLVCFFVFLFITGTCLYKGDSYLHMNLLHYF